MRVNDAAGLSLTIIPPVQTIVGPANQCTGRPGECTAGSTISLHATAVGLDVPGIATLDGISYSDVGGPNSPASLHFDFTGQVLGPPFGPSGFAVVTVPVDFSGIFFNQPAQEQLVASAHATLTLQQTDCCGGPAWLYQDVRYDLTPVPEPSTLLLFGTAMAIFGIAWAIRSNRDRAIRGLDRSFEM
jgi:hypothetical protein